MRLFLFISLSILSPILSGQVPPSTSPLYKHPSHKSNLSNHLNSKNWDKLFPNRYGKGEKYTGKNLRDFYSLKAFIKAAGYFPQFLSSKDTAIQKRELAAFLANIAQETSGGWETAPGGYFSWGLFFIDEVHTGEPVQYADMTKPKYPPVAGKYYYGRGPKQLSWNYNYGQFSEAWFGNKDTLLLHPEKISSDPVLAFASAIWFWMTPQYPKPSCHEIMTGQWQPNDNDIANGRLQGFGATVNIINGGIECGLGNDLDKTTHRYKYYEYFCHYFNVSPGENIKCTYQKPFGSSTK